MSENLNRSNPDFSKYDSMSIGELEEILRADALGPERDDSDVDEILYVMEVLAKKRRQNGTAGKTALEAYQEFQQHYLPMAEEDSKPRRKSIVIPFRRIAAVAASLVLVFSLANTANAFGWKDIWNAVARWAEETFSISCDDKDTRDPHSNDIESFGSLQMALSEDKHDVEIPSFIPVEYQLTDIIIDRNPIQDTYLAIYSCDDKSLKISVQSFLVSEPEQIEVSDELIEIYTVSDVDYYLLQNNNVMQAVWITESYECYIAGELSITDLKLMIDSIGKG